MTFGFPHASAGHPGMMGSQPSFGGFGGQATMGPTDLYIGSAGFQPHLSAGHPSPMVHGRPRLLTVPAPAGTGYPNQLQPFHSSLQDIYSPQTPTSPFDAQQARSMMQLRQMQAARAAHVGHPRSHTMSFEPGHPSQRRSSISMSASPMMGSGMPAFRPKQEDDFGDFDSQMQFRPEFDHETSKCTASSEETPD